MEPNTGGQPANRMKLLFSSILGVALMLTPIGLIYLDPVMSYAKYKFRLDNGTMLHELMQRPFHGLKVHVYLFNITNAEEFVDGTDQKIKLNEVGPFVFQEIRTNEDIVLNPKSGIMRFTPKMRPVFIPEESIGDPKDISLTLPNFSLQYIAAYIGKYPFLVQQLFNYVVSQTQAKPFNNIKVHDALWGREDPLVSLANKILPGLYYFKSCGLLERLYDFEYDYRLEVGTTNLDKFALKQSIRTKPKDKPDSDTYFEKTLILPNDTYEGEVFPMELSPGQPINIYRPSVCKTFQFEYTGSRAMSYGGDAFIYKLRESLLNDKENCFTNGWCPSGLMNISPCYWGLPTVISKGHFLGADPRLQDLMDGFKPDRNIHDEELVIDPKVGITMEAALSVQVSIFLSNLAYSPQTRRLQDTVMPIVHYIMKSPPLIEEVSNALHFVYTDGPRMLLSAQICCVLLGLGLLAYSAWLLYLICLVRTNALNEKKEDFLKTQRPLLMERISQD